MPLANFNQNPYDVDLRKLTFAEVYERWCQQKFKGEPVKRVYVAAYKNLTINGKPLLNGDNLRYHVWDKSPLLKNHLPHDGRHTCATLMDDAEIPLKSKQLILGHSASDITNKVYTHKTVKQLIDAINKI